MQIQANDRTVTVREYTFTITDTALAVYLDDPAEWAADTRALLGLPAATAPARRRKTRRTGAKRAPKKAAARRATKGGTPKGKAQRRRKASATDKPAKAFQCPQCPRSFKGQGHLDRHIVKVHQSPQTPSRETPATTER
ncbi:MAG: C2H2-type zinc finger protein [Anaerolineales bacterium]|nr:C2H2-type zinc finger protein [Anaerolineales bacterium]